MKTGATTAPVLVVGSYNEDMVWSCAELPRPGETRIGRFRSGPGGKGYNQALAAARLGVATGFVCALGNDALGQRAWARFASDGLESHVQTIAGEATGTAAVLVDAHGHNQIVVAPGANARLETGFLDGLEPAFAAAQLLLTQMECGAELARHALQRGRSAGCLCVLNPAPAEAALDQGLLRLADVLTPNETEFAAICTAVLGQPLGVDPAACDDELLHARCRALGIPVVIITLGAHGAFVSQADPRLFGDELPHYRVPTPSARVVDTTGAGDCFNGALAAALVCREPLHRAVAFACAAAALSTEAPGAAEAMPTLQALKARYPG